MLNSWCQVCGCLGTHLAKAVIAIDRTDSRRLERHFGLGPAVCTDSGIHLSGSGANSSTPLLFATRAAVLAPARFVGKPPASVELLLTRAEHEGVTTIRADYFLVSVHHVETSSSDTMLRADRPLAAKKRYQRRSRLYPETVACVSIHQAINYASGGCPPGNSARCKLTQLQSFLGNIEAKTLRLGLLHDVYQLLDLVC